MAAWVDEQLVGTVSRLKVVQAAVLFLESLSEGEADAICRRAREFGVRQVGELKNISRLGLHRREPAAEAPTPTPTTSKFARPLDELARHHKEADHVWN